MNNGNKIVKWGIIGPGKIANKFADDIKLVDNAKLIACASHDLNKAMEFKEKHGLEFFYGSYDEMLDNPEIDAVYIATTHNFHYENALLCIKHGKHILCEKAFTINAKQAEEIFEKAKAKNLFVMEGMWARFLPAAKWVKEQIRKGEIGEIVSVFAQYGVKIPFNPQSRAYNINLAGGGLLDLGIYPLSFACNILGCDPVEISGVAKIGQTGVDEQASISLKYKNGESATITCSMLDNYENTAIVYGTKGKIFINQASMPTKAKLFKNNDYNIEYESLASNGFEYEISEATSLILKGELESPTITAQDTIGILKICDTLRGLWNFRYPDERI